MKLAMDLLQLLLENIEVVASKSCKPDELAKVLGMRVGSNAPVCSWSEKIVGSCAVYAQLSFNRWQRLIAHHPCDSSDNFFHLAIN
jgi:hypothetical protein